jgi:hypothetical protein
MSHRQTGIPRGIPRAAAALLLLATALASTACATTRRDPPDACRLDDIPQAQWLVRVPFETVDGRIYVQAKVDGRGPFRFAVDTGASGMARADASLLPVLGLAIQGRASSSDGVQTAEVDTTHLASIELDRLVRRDLDVITRDYASHGSAESRFSGLLARDFFGDGLLVIDYPRHRLSFTRSRALPSTGNVLPYERAFRVPVSIGAVQAIGNLDTGAAVTFVLPRALYDQVATGALGPAGRGQLTNGTIATNRATLRGPFRVGDLSLSDVEVRVSDRYPELLVGAQALQDTVLLIDQPSKRIAVCR